MEKTHAAVTGKGSSLSNYQQVVVGNRSFRRLLYFEFCQLLSLVPGAPGMALRKLFWPRLFAGCGRKTVFGHGIVLRHPGRIRLGNAVVISEYCVLDGRHSQTDRAIEIGDGAILSTNVMLSCKDGTITIGRGVGINAQSIIQSTNNNPVVIGDDCVIGQRCLVIGGGSYDIDQPGTLIRSQPIRADGGVVVANNVWLGANVTVLGGVNVGEGSVAAAASVITKSVPPYSVCMGVPARVVRKRS
ncbi:MAG: acyltransferase [Desulfofustis sp.]|nr:acyltransferase [Desulfofustis sp.]